MYIGLVFSVSTSGPVPVLLLCHLYRIMAAHHRVDLKFRSSTLISAHPTSDPMGFGTLGQRDVVGSMFCTLEKPWSITHSTAIYYWSFWLYTALLNPTPSLNLAYRLHCVLWRSVRLPAIYIQYFHFPASQSENYTTLSFGQIVDVTVYVLCSAIFINLSTRKSPMLPFSDWPDTNVIANGIVEGS